MARPLGSERNFPGSTKDSKVSEQPPQDDEHENGGEASAAEFLRSVAGGQAAQDFAHVVLRRNWGEQADD